MAQRTPFLGGNWKMNTTPATALELAAAVATKARAFPRVDVAIYPPFPFLQATVAVVAGGALVGGQDCSSEIAGAFTGQTSAGMLADLGCTSVLIGHSERRHGLGETDAVLSKKLGRAIDAGLVPVLCVGETLVEREAGHTHEIIGLQLRGALAGHSAEAMSRLVVAYEPVWAIGTGRTATPDDAAEAHRTVHRTLGVLYDVRFSERVRVIYGGSVNAKNAADLFSREEIDGGLVGGASLQAADFAAIIDAASLRA